jgi:hypothetical protein
VPEAEGAADVSEPQSDVEREAKEFMEENELLLNVGGYATLQKVVMQASRIAKDLSAERIEAADRLKTAARDFGKAVRDPTTRPLMMHRLELEQEQAKEVLDRKERIGEDFNAFFERAVSAYRQERGKVT